MLRQSVSAFLKSSSCRASQRLFTQAPLQAASSSCLRFYSAASSASHNSSSKGGSQTSTNKLVSTLQAEVQYEKSNYEQAATISNFLSSSSGWNLVDKDGDINMAITKKNVKGDLSVTVEFQLVSPSYAGEEDEESNTQNEAQETTDFSVSVEKPNGNGAIFYCTTVGNDEKFRFIVGNVRYFETNDEKISVTAYNGPEFEDLDDNLQSGVDEWLSEIGINEQLCDFVDAMAVDKEQREYMRWLTKIAEIVQ